MIRNLKALGLAVVAVFAMSAMAASAAQAAPEFTGIETIGAEHNHVHSIIEGEQSGFHEFLRGFGGRRIWRGRMRKSHLSRYIGNRHRQ